MRSRKTLSRQELGIAEYQKSRRIEVNNLNPGILLVTMVMSLPVCARANNQELIEFIEEITELQTAAAKQEAKKLNIRVEEKTIAGVTVRYINPPTVDPSMKDRLFIHTHGGAYVFGGGYAGVQEGLRIARYTKIPVISIDYRMPPEHPFPAALDDVLAVYKELIKQHDPKTIAIGGSSAGGGLAMASIYKFKAEELELPGAIFLGSPWTDLKMIWDSSYLYEEIEEVLVSFKELLEGSAHLYAGENDMNNPLISPIYGDVSEFPPTYLVAGKRDLFFSNTVRVHRKLRIAGVITILTVCEEVSPGGYGFVFRSPENEQVYIELSEFLNEHLR